MQHCLVRQFVVAITPPFVIGAVRRFRQWLNPPSAVLEYSPGGWDQRLVKDAPDGWNAESVVDATRAENAESVRLLKEGGPLGTGHQHNLHVSFAYVLARAAFNKTTMSVLDWGGGLGYYYYVAKAALPDVRVDYHCKETVVLADAGRQVVSEVQWHADESCLGQSYDVVMLSGSLQYAGDWQAQLRRIAGATAEWLYVTRLPVVDRVPTFAAVQRVYGSVMLHWQFNRAEVLRFVESLGFEVEREFEIGDRPDVKNAPEPCELRGWLFRRVKPK